MSSRMKHIITARYSIWITLVAAKPSAVPPEGDEILLSFLLPSL